MIFCVPWLTVSVKSAVLLNTPDVTLTVILRLLTALVGALISAPVLSKARPRSVKAVDGSLA